MLTLYKCMKNQTITCLNERFTHSDINIFRSHFNNKVAIYILNKKYITFSYLFFKHENPCQSKSTKVIGTLNIL